MLLKRGVFERAIAAIATQRVAHRVPAIRVLQCRTLSWREVGTFGHATACIGPHIRDVQVRLSVRVVIEPASAHPWADVLHTGTRSQIIKLATLVYVKILSTEIIGDVQVRPAFS